MSLTLLAAALVAASPGPAGAQAPEAGELLERAAEAARSLRSARYEAEAEVAGGSSRRLVRGTVALSRVDFTDPVGGRLALRGEVERARGRGTETFEIAYDGREVWRLRPEVNTLLHGDILYGGEALLAGSSRVLVVEELLAEEPYRQERRAASASYAGTQDVAGVACHVVEVELEEPGTGVRWYLGVDDALPRRREHRYLSASGNPVTSVLTLRELEPDVALDEAVFRIEAPEGAAVEQVGRRPPPPLRVGAAPPDFSLIDEDGRSHALADFRGRVVLMEFWSTWCTFCQRAMPSMQRLHEAYGGRGLAVLGIHCRERIGEPPPVEFARSRGHTYPVIPDGNKAAIDYGVRSIPAFYIIGPDGRLLYQEDGFAADSEQQFARIIEANLPG